MNIKGTSIPDENMPTADTPLGIDDHRFSDAFHFNPLAGAIVRLDDAYFVEVNEAFCNLLGWTRDELVGHTAIDIGLWENAGARQEWARTIRQKGELRDFHVDWFTRTRERRHMSIYAKTMHVDGTTCIISLSRDDTTAADAKKAADLAQQRLFDFFAFLPDPTFAIDQNGIVIAWNRAQEDETGIPAADMIGKGNYEVGLRLYGIRRPVLADLLLHDDPQYNQSYLVKVHERKTLYGESDNVILKGKRHVYTAKAGLIYGTNGEIVGAIQQARDVTAIREAQKKLDHSEQLVRKLSLAVEQSPHGVVITDLRGRIEYANKHALKCHGFSGDMAIGKLAVAILAKSTSTRRWEDIWSRLKAGDPWVGELSFPGGAARPWIALTSILPIRQLDGAVSNYLVIEQDITAEKAIEAELEQHRHHLEEQVLERTLQLATAKEIAEEASRAKGNFLANMSHEIRTPLNAIVGLTRMLQKGAVSAEQKQQIEKIKSAATHLTDIVNDILDYSKIEAGKLELQNESISLRQVADNVSGLLHDRIREKRLSLRQEISSDVPDAVQGDSLRIGQILLNFLGNAVKFTERGEIVLRLRTETDGNPDHVALLFEVEDEGIGLSEAQTQKLFQAFEQAESSTTRKYGGTGLGLAICKRLAELMGGKVGVSSRLGEGSIFWLRLRLPKALPPSSRTVEDALPDEIRAIPNNASLLVVEDSALNQEIIIDLLREFGLSRIAVAENGLEAINHLKRFTVDLILMDMQMPVMDGLEATRKIRQLPGTRNIPVLGVTANVFAGDRKLCLDAGMNDVITKPINPELLHAQLARWLAKPHAAEPETRLIAPAITQAPGQNAHEETLFLRISALPGVDSARGLRMLRGKIKAYINILFKFVAAHRSDMDTLKAYLQAGKTDDAVRVAHTLKGLSATLGLTAIQEQATMLEAALKESPPPDVLQTYMVELDRHLSLLATHLNSENHS